MAITGYYSNGVIVTDAILKEKQEVIITPIKTKKSAFGSLKKYANPSFISKEKEAFRSAVVKKHKKN